MLKTAVFFAAVVGSALFVANSPEPSSVSVKGVHLCCGGCQSIAEDALADLPGVTDASADLNAKVVSFKADNEKSAAAGLKALAEAGFFGSATYQKNAMKFPASGAKSGSKANSITLTNVHLCCTACVTASQTALQSVKGVNVIDIDRNEKTIKLTGDAVNVSDAVNALNQAGFFCRLKPADNK